MCPLLGGPFVNAPLSTSPGRAPAGAPAAEEVRSPAWVAALVALVAVLAFAYAALMRYCFGQWLKPDYSHGFLVPLFSAYLAYHWRDWAPRRIDWPQPWGLAFVAGGIALFVVPGKLNIAKEWLQGLSLVLNLCGVALLLGGWPALRWLWPSLAFLMFMFPLPDKVEHAMGSKLQVVAAAASEFVLQTVGYATYREGVILHARDQVLEVEKACSGLSMLLTFVALSTGMAILVDRPWFDRALILASAIPVAVLANVIRIALTGVLYNEGGQELGDRVFHDFAGWMMMPIALAVLWGELKLLDWVWVPDGGPAGGGEVVRLQASPAHLVMAALPGAGAPAAAKPLPPAPKGAPR
jgi:exosortase